MKSYEIKIGNRIISETSPCFIVAEAGVNHNGKIRIAKKLIKVAKDIGADAVKFQIFIPNEIVTADAKKASYQEETEKNSKTQREMLKKLALTEDQLSKLKNYAKKIGIPFFATPHDLSSLDIFTRLDMPIIKIASSDIDNGLLFYKIAKNPKLKNKPLFLSTGTATFKAVNQALNFLRDQGFTGQIIVYQCTSSYPTPANEQNLNVIKTYKKSLGSKYQVLVGFSDNGDNIDIPVDAVALGAVSVEKHLTLDKNMEGPDHKASLNPVQFSQMVNSIRNLEQIGRNKIRCLQALGKSVKKPQKSELENIPIVRKAIRAKRNLKANSIVAIEDITAKRPQGENSALNFHMLLGKRLTKDVLADEEISLKMVK